MIQDIGPHQLTNVSKSTPLVYQMLGGSRVILLGVGLVTPETGPGRAGEG